jgi:phage tail tape-measure protein
VEDIMANIIAGHFDQQAEVQHAIGELVRAGFAPERISSFYVSSAGRHDETSIGGDHAVSPGAEDSGKGDATGAAIGAAAGAVTAPLLGPVGPVVGGLLGAHVGGLVGAMSQMGDAGDTPPVRRSGMMVAVDVMGGENEQRAIDTLRALGASDIERATGTISDGDWHDFDPVRAPQWVDPTARRSMP